VINTIQGLRTHLQWAIELEHSTLPPYLCALYSLEDGRNPDAREVITSVFLEEMLHLTLAANILNAVGGSPQIDVPRILPRYPAYLAHSDRSFKVELRPFSAEALETFLRIERPAAHSGLPEDDAYETIGQFYEAIKAGLRELSDRLGEGALFCGNPERQVNEEHYYGGSGRIIAVADLASALSALEEIVEQGEGLQHQEVWDEDRSMFHPERDEVAHYFRFLELKEGRRFQRGDTPRSGPTGAPIAVDWDAVHPMRINPRASDYSGGSEIRAGLDRFNRAYSGLLHLLHETFNGSPRLLRVATGGMYALKAHALALMQLPSGDGETTVGPSFDYVPRHQRHTHNADDPRILVVPDGPYLVYGGVPLVRKRKITSEAGDSVSWQLTEHIETEDVYALCRCGRSQAKPFCDGSHARFGFDGTEAAEIRPSAERQRIVDGGTGIVVKRDGYLCMHAAFCVGAKRKVPAMLPDTADSDTRAQVIGMIERCPSGSYLYALGEDTPDVEPHLPVAIAATTDGGELAGPLWVTGGLPIERADGQSFETRNRVTLCRCGHSRSKPLCDGTHRDIEFQE
jgi:CDGSH-type Zn-finger protein